MTSIKLFESHPVRTKIQVVRDSPAAFFDRQDGILLSMRDVMNVRFKGSIERAYDECSLAARPHDRFGNTQMKRLLIVTSACLFFVACACSVSAHRTDELHTDVRLTTGERSRDSSSETTKITVEQDTIVWEKSFTGRRRGTPPSRKDFTLSSVEKRNLLTLIRSNNLLVTDSIERPRKSSNYRYFEISVELTLDEQKGAISISGMRTDLEVKEEKLYQNTLTLVKELYRIMNLQDNSMTFVDIIDEPKKN